MTLNYETPLSVPPHNGALSSRVYSEDINFLQVENTDPPDCTTSDGLQKPKEENFLVTQITM